MKKKGVIGASLALVLILAGCNRTEEKAADSGAVRDPLQLSHFVRSYTSGEVSRASAIEVHFARDLADDAEIGQVLPSSPFRFEPEIAGTATWSEARVLRFVPDARLEPGVNYTAHLSLARFYPKIADELKVFTFRFRTLRRAFDIRFNQLKTSDMQSLKWQYLEGMLTASDQEEAGDIEKIVSARQGDVFRKIKWDHGPNGREHRFRIDDIERKNSAGGLDVFWDARFLDSDFQGKQTIAIPALNAFNLIAHEALSEPEQHIILTFSDPLRADQDPRGLIHIPGDDSRFLIEGNQIKIYPATRLVGDAPVFVEKGVENVLGYKIKKRQTLTVTFEEPRPELRLNGNGVIVPGSEGVHFPFEAVNINAVDVQVTKIFEDRIPQFLQVNNLLGEYELQRVGEVVATKKIALDPSGETDLKQWNRHVIDLGNLFETDPGSIYRISLGFRHEYSLYACGAIDGLRANNALDSGEGPVDWRYYTQAPYNWRNRDNPCHRAYFHRYRNVSRNVLVSDLGMIAKSGQDKKMRFFVTDLNTAAPVSAAKLRVYDYRQHQLAELTTDDQGMAESVFEEHPFLAVAERRGRKGYLVLRFGEDLQLSKFDVGGTQLPEGLNGFLYGERGVWRPGDTVFLTFVLRDKDGALPEDHPVQLEFYDPRGRLVERMVSTEGLDGFFTFQIQTRPEDMTGNYQAVARVGGAVFNKTIKIETVMPNRLKIDLQTDPLTAAQPEAQARLAVTWLHGAVARNLKADVQVRLRSVPTRFDNFRGFVFDDPIRHFSGEPQALFTGAVDSNGKASFPVKLPPMSNMPGRLSATFQCKVFEPGGAFSTDQFSSPYDPYRVYAGVRLPFADQYQNALMTDRDHMLEFVTVNAEGGPVAGRELSVSVYRLQWRWWWDQDANEAARYNSNLLSSPVAEGSITTDQQGRGAWPFRMNYPEWGRFLVRVCDADGHCGGQVFYADWPDWAGRPTIEEPGGAAMLTFSADKETYQTGETVTLSIPTGAEGRVLVSIESSTRVLHTAWLPVTQGETRYTFEATPAMAPNVYANVSLLQPHAQTANDLPIRLYGVIPIMIEDPQTRLEPKLEMPDVLRPQSQVEIKVSETNNRVMTYTLALVDEGLLDLTRHRTPNPRSFFYAREALSVRTWDLYDLVMGAHGGEMKTLLQIGGGEAEVQIENPKANRFAPVVRFLGPFTLAAGETQAHKLDIPLYVGSVKTMVVAGHDGAYGSAEKATPVRKPLMLLGTLPRVLGPGEEVEFPLSVFAMEDHIREVEVEITTNDLLIPDGPTRRTLRFERTGDQLARFSLKVPDRIGIGLIKATARSGGETATFEIELDIRNPNPYLSNIEHGRIAAGETGRYAYNPIGMSGANSGAIEVSMVPPMNLDDRLEYLIGYPHGCVEQVTSSVFPQLFLSKVMELSDDEKREVDKNVKAGIARLATFQNLDGSLSYWPGLSHISDWGTSYAGHFMIEAQRTGYNLPPNFLNNWLSFQRLAANSWNGGQSWSEVVQAYRLYLLALAEQPRIGAMNRFRERGQSREISKWLLAAAYHLAGQVEAARQMTVGLTIRIPDYQELAWTYGSSLRDQAMILEAMRVMGLNEKAAAMTETIAEHLRSSRWYNTQALGFGLMAMARGAASGQTRLDFEIQRDDGGWESIQRDKPMERIRLAGDDSTTIHLRNRGDRPLYVTTYARGQPLTGGTGAESENLGLEIAYLDLAGNNIDPSRITQGTDFYARVTLLHPGRRRDYQEMALTQIFPSGWEIHNARLNEMAESAFAKPEFEDTRDDRVYRYFDQKSGQKLVFQTMLNASYAGRFYLPPVQAEAMYDRTIHAHQPGRWVEVVSEDGDGP